METAPSELLANLIVGVSAFGLGLVIYLAGTNIRTALHTTGHRRYLNVAYAVARIGFVIMVGLITEAVFRTGGVLPTWRTWAYTVAAVMVAAGYLGVVYESRHVSHSR